MTDINTNTDINGIGKSPGDVILDVLKQSGITIDDRTQLTSRILIELQDHGWRLRRTMTDIEEADVKAHFRGLFWAVYQGLTDDADKIEMTADEFADLGWKAVRDSIIAYQRSVLAHEPTRHLHLVFHGRLYHSFADELRRHNAHFVTTVGGQSVAGMRETILASYISQLEWLLPADIRSEIRATDHHLEKNKPE